MANARIFISYRRDDSAGFARAIGDALGQRFGRERIFLDVDDIGAGEAFDAEIERAVGASSVLLVLIGRRWAGAVDGTPQRRIDDPEDFVRHEVETGLARGLQVIPLLLDGATMPVEHELPEAMRPLARRQALPIDNARFNADIEHLEAVLRGVLGRRVGAPVSPRARLGLGAATLVVIAAAGFGWWRSQGRPAINGNWVAQARYDWPNADYTERFTFDGEGRDLHGKAGFLGSYRGIVEGRVEPAGNLTFLTRSHEQLGSGAPKETTHRYRGKLTRDSLRLVMQTEGGFTEHVPVEFKAQRELP